MKINKISTNYLKNTYNFSKKILKNTMNKIKPYKPYIKTGFAYSGLIFMFGTIFICLRDILLAKRYYNRQKDIEKYINRRETDIKRNNYTI